MSFLYKALTGLLMLLLVLILAALLLIRQQAMELVYHPPEARSELERTPAELGLDYQDVQVSSTDGNILYGWYIPPENGAVIMGLHGYKWNRSAFIEEAEMFTRHGFGFLFMSVRSHDVNEGELIAFGLREMPDLQAWYEFLLARPEVNRDRIGIIGESLGASMALQFSADNPGVRAVATQSAFSSMQDTIETSIGYFTGLPAFPFAPMIQFWVERELSASIEDINASRWIRKLAPRPVFIMHGLSDTVVSPGSGQLLYQAAGEPKELWLEAELGHGGFEKEFPAEFERRLVQFFSDSLL